MGTVLISLPCQCPLLEHNRTQMFLISTFKFLPNLFRVPLESRTMLNNGFQRKLENCVVPVSVLPVNHHLSSAQCHWEKMLCPRLAEGMSVAQAQPGIKPSLSSWTACLVNLSPPGLCSETIWESAGWPGPKLYLGPHKELEGWMFELPLSCPDSLA